MRLPGMLLLAVGTALVVSWSALTAQSGLPGTTMPAASRPDGPGPDAGLRLYREGIASGRAVDATVQGDLRVPSSDMACTNCHRRSGLGTVEGPVTTPPVTGRVLFNPVTLGNSAIGVRTTGPGTRPAYDGQSLARVLRDGIDPAGRVLSPTMPRYALSDADVTDLAAYLRTLDAAPPGVTGTTLHLATITSPAAEPRRQEAMLAVLREYVRSMNAEPRYQTRRREVGPWDMKSHYELYRRWELHEWSLSGNPRDWRAELAAQYARQPVFAVVSGTAAGDWSPIHAFCEQAGVPCVFPQTATPPGARVDAGFYSLYFSPGVTLEAAALAAHVSKARPRESGPRVVQVARCSGQGEIAARALSASLPPALAGTTRCVESADDLTPAFWRGLIDEGPAFVAAWLEPAETAGLAALASTPEAFDRVERLYVSASLLGEKLNLPGAARGKSYVLDPFIAPDDFDKYAARGLAWIKRRGLAAPDRRAAIGALYAMTIVGDAMSMPRVLTSREYFVEQIEHMVGRSPQPSAYPALSLGPQRRFGSLGCYVLKVPPEAGGAFAKVEPWFVPELK